MHNQSISEELKEKIESLFYDFRDGVIGIDDAVFRAITAEREELMEKVKKLEYEWAGTNEEKEKDKFVYLYEVLSLLEEK